MKNHVCLHGHFYQPPRENPWLEEIELQDSAHPYSNWNERITSECYAPNMASRILDSKGNIIDIVNNYVKMSFNFGPTLLSWMERKQPDVYKEILQADRVSQTQFSGHGAAIAQAYNHMIMPLANSRDKKTQVLWGLKDFEFRFQRKSEGMWLPETAVDMATLEVLAEFDIRFTILAPHQAKSFRKIGEENWENVQEKGLDPHKAYVCKLPSGKEIILFFYDGPVSHDIAFGGLLKNGDAFAGRLLSLFSAVGEAARIVHVATDGESYGHHHRFGNMALSYCLHAIEVAKTAQITIFGEFLEKNPPAYEVEIVENTSWSCAHGVERWRGNCGCHIGGHANWNQKWRAPLRDAMDWLRDNLAPIYEKEMSQLVKDPWMARDEYIQVLLDRAEHNVNEFIQCHAIRELSYEEKVKILKLLEMQRHAMFMYTSCGWFFDEISGIETVQILQYAARAIQLAKKTATVDLEPEFIRKLEAAPSNSPRYKNGADVYKKTVEPAIVSLLNVAAHYAISSLFEEYPEAVQIYCYTINTDTYHQNEVGKQKLVIGKAKIRSMISWDECQIDFAVLHFGEYNLCGGVRYHQDDEAFEKMYLQLNDIFGKNDIPQVLQLMKDHFGDHNYSLWDLFKNEQSKVLNQVFVETRGAIEKHFRQIYEHYAPLMRIRPDIRIPLPKGLAMTVEFILMRDIVEVLENDPIDFDRLEKLADEIKRWAFTRDKDTLGFVASKTAHRLMEEIARNPKDVTLLRKMCSLLRILQALSLTLDLWEAQNVYFSIAQKEHGAMRAQADKDDKQAKQWVSRFNGLGKYLLVKIKNS